MELTLKYSIRRRSLGNYSMFNKVFNIIRKPGVIHLDCFTCIQEVKQFFPIQYARDVMPEWYKKLPTTVKYQGPMRGTMKTCPGVADYFRNGFVIQSWRDFYFEINDKTLSVDPESEADLHHPAQWGEALKGWSHAKLICPWRIQEKTGVNFLFNNAFWHNQQKNYFVPSGVVNYKHQTTANVNLVINNSMYPNNCTITGGEPLVHCIPMSDKKIKIHTHLVTPIEYTMKQSYHWSWAGQYYKNKKMREAK